MPCRISDRGCVPASILYHWFFSSHYPADG
ncbi:MAG: hypothetical protein DRP52_03485 [Planctomycetota bacterium]|nr:MAG: hypothetical protein DRP52_03485 [Planctomycetota bacterium]